MAAIETERRIRKNPPLWNIFVAMSDYIILLPFWIVCRMTDAQSRAAMAHDGRAPVYMGWDGEVSRTCAALGTSFLF